MKNTTCPSTLTCTTVFQKINFMVIEINNGNMLIDESTALPTENQKHEIVSRFN